MENFRSNPVNEGRILQTPSSYGRPQTPSSFHDMRSHRTTCAQSPRLGKDLRVTKEEIRDGGGSSSSPKIWDFFSHPDMQRKRRVAGYRVYSVQGKMKGSLRKSFRWIKDTCTHLVHG